MLNTSAVVTIPSRTPTMPKRNQLDSLLVSLDGSSNLLVRSTGHPAGLLQ